MEPRMYPRQLADELIKNLTAHVDLNLQVKMVKISYYDKLEAKREKNRTYYQFATAVIFVVACDVAVFCFAGLNNVKSTIISTLLSSFCAFTGRRHWMASKNWEKSEAAFKEGRDKLIEEDLKRRANATSIENEIGQMLLETQLETASNRNPIIVPRQYV